MRSADSSYFVIDGIFEIAAGLQMRPASGSGWMLFGGIVSVVIAVMIWRQFPLFGPWAIGILLGIKLFFIGLIMITGGSVVRSARLYNTSPLRLSKQFEGMSNPVR